MWIWNHFMSTPTNENSSKILFIKILFTIEIRPNKNIFFLITIVLLPDEHDGRLHVGCPGRPRLHHGPGTVTDNHLHKYLVIEARKSNEFYLICLFLISNNYSDVILILSPWIR